MKLQKGDIVLVDFPFSNLRKTKKRPALVLCSLEGENTILCQITTKSRKIRKYEINLKKEDCEGNIQFDSLIYLDMIFTLHKNLVHGKIGKIKNLKVRSELRNKMKFILD